MSTCEHCGHDDGEELIEVTPEVLAAAVAVGKVYKHASGGGNLHFLIDDGNVDGYIDEDLWHDFGNNTSKAQKKAEKECLKLLSALNEDERYAVLRVCHEYISKKLDAPVEVNIA